MASKMFPMLLLVAAVAAPGPLRAEEDLAAGIDVPKFEMPSLDLPSLDTPDLGDVEVEKADKKDEVALDSSPSRVTYGIEKVTFARAFKNTKTGCVPRDEIKSFRLPQLPAKTEPFQTCLRLTATSGVVASLQAHITAPDNKRVAEASGEVSFARKSNTVDFVVDWGGFPVRHPGEYVLTIVVGREKKATFPVKVEGP